MSASSREVERSVDAGEVAEITWVEPAAPVNGDLTRPVVLETPRTDWVPSPSPSVWRKRLHRVGPAEAGQVTSLVRFEPGSRFPEHGHPEGEEILVLEGVFSDEHGDWPAGTYLLNPEGFRHAPFSREGCLLFVKLRQAPGVERRHVALRTEALAWTPTGRPGIERKPLHVQPEFRDATYLERWAAGTDPGEESLQQGAEIFVLEGDLADERGAYGPGTWLRLPVRGRHRPRTRGGCTIYVKYGGIPGLRSA
jgi:anti-sigma factor ChrR (cupin superfamily)